MDLDSILRSTKRSDGSDFFNEKITQSYDSSEDYSEEVEDEYDDEEDVSAETEEYEFTKRNGETSSIETQNLTYGFDAVNWTVRVFVGRIDNKSSWTTGELKITCYISDQDYNGSDWDNNNKFVGEEIIGHLEPGYGFPNLGYSLNVDKSILPGNYKRWRFVFLICELNNDDNWYIIDYRNGRCNLTDKDRNIIINTLIDKLGVDRSEIHDDAEFITDLGADELDMVELIIEFEKNFGITISDEDAENIRTVGDVFDYLSTVL